MNNYSDILANISRHALLKAAAMALSIAFLASACSRQPGATDKSAAAPDTQSSTTQQKKQWRIFDDHIPPLTIFGGSFQMDIKHELGGPTASSIAARPHRRLAMVPDHEQYGHIKHVYVFTSYEKYIDFDPYENLQPDCKLLIWLQSAPSGSSSPYNPVGPEADIQIKGNEYYPVGGKILKTMSIETIASAIDRKYSHRRYCPNRYSYPSSPGNNDFQIGKWEIRDKGGIRLHGGETSEKGPDGFQFVVVFDH
jgi:hypothetical protein